MLVGNVLILNLKRVSILTILEVKLLLTWLGTGADRVGIKVQHSREQYCYESKHVVNQEHHHHGEQKANEGKPPGLQLLVPRLVLFRSL